MRRAAPSSRRPGFHAATRTFQALRIRVNRELEGLGEAIERAAACLRPGGRFYCLEFSRVRSAAVAKIYDSYSERALPLIGRLVAGDADSYRYLHESIRRFPPQKELATRMKAVGFANVAWRDLTLGVVALHGGWRI